MYIYIFICYYIYKGGGGRERERKKDNRIKLGVHLRKYKTKLHLTQIRQFCCLYRVIYISVDMYYIVVGVYSSCIVYNLFFSIIVS